MKPVFKEKVIQGMVFKEVNIQGAVYKEKVVFAPNLPPEVPSTAENMFAQLYDFTRTGDEIHIQPTGTLPTQYSKQNVIAGKSVRLFINMDISVGLNTAAQEYYIKLGTLSGKIPLTGSVITGANTVSDWYHIYNVYVYIDGVYWTSFEFNGATKVDVFSANLPASPEYSGVELYQKPAEYYDQIIKYSKADGATPAALKAKYDALLAKIADGATQPFLVEVYWA